jgi:hypothetical protein
MTPRSTSNRARAAIKIQAPKPRHVEMPSCIRRSESCTPRGVLTKEERADVWNKDELRGKADRIKGGLKKKARIGE